MQKASGDKKSAAVRAGAAATLLAIAKTCGRAAEPYLVPALSWCLELAADKDGGARDTAAEAVTYICTEVVGPASICQCMPELLGALAFAKKWQTKVRATPLLSRTRCAARCYPSSSCNSVE